MDLKQKKKLLKFMKNIIVSIKIMNKIYQNLLLQRD